MLAFSIDLILDGFFGTQRGQMSGEVIMFLQNNILVKVLANSWFFPSASNYKE